jgi:hypothetical protein
MARSVDPFSYATVVAYVYFPGIPFGARVPDDRALREIEDALRITERFGDDMALAFTRVTLGIALLHRPTDDERSSGRKLLAEAGDVFLRRQHNLSELRLVDVYLAREKARQGDPDEAISQILGTLDRLGRERQLMSWGIPVTGVLVDTLLGRGAAGDIEQAEAAIARLAGAPADDGLALRDIWLLRMRALLAGAQGDMATYAHLRQRHREMACTLGFEGHLAWADM